MATSRSKPFGANDDGWGRNGLPLTQLTVSTMHDKSRADTEKGIMGEGI